MRPLICILLVTKLTSAAGDRRRNLLWAGRLRVCAACFVLFRGQETAPRVVARLTSDTRCREKLDRFLPEGLPSIALDL
jgi:hypothetical protein